MNIYIQQAFSEKENENSNKLFLSLLARSIEKIKLAYPHAYIADSFDAANNTVTIINPYDYTPITVSADAVRKTFGVYSFERNSQNNQNKSLINRTVETANRAYESYSNSQFVEKMSDYLNTIKKDRLKSVFLSATFILLIR